ncbi:transcriptional regulator, TetR family [Thalassococcus halodurans]|uniref:Transcriptional regulator, TetR family n=1 Tax=Thalassococcus halodurans TaxID=373675 RepID=A0A1H5XNE5_9RHOB|nr:TetR/AcrR family transcriptional regulator [Thalassococcus halodurans]SEG13258.1 transcriptional regulator, TetR family [Thalassococcus halodurans]
MRDDKKQDKHEAITTAAYALLADKGYAGASMLSIAKAAKASNETLYRWYGDKRGLFEAMARDNAQGIRHRLEQALSDDQDAMQALEQIAPLLLSMLLDDRAISLNRAAAADPSGELGAAISAGGRDEIVPLIRSLISRLAIKDTDGLNPTDLFVTLLVGDLQIKRAIGALPQLSQEQVTQRAREALISFRKLVGLA